ncbi:hypothetical protein VTK26DRAFT_1596 [Humicola hyalothermophila]
MATSWPAREAVAMSHCSGHKTVLRPVIQRLSVLLKSKGCHDSMTARGVILSSGRRSPIGLMCKRTALEAFLGPF